MQALGRSSFEGSSSSREFAKRHLLQLRLRVSFRILEAVGEMSDHLGEPAALCRMRIDDEHRRIDRIALLVVGLFECRLAKLQRTDDPIGEAFGTLTGTELEARAGENFVCPAEGEDHFFAFSEEDRCVAAGGHAFRASAKR